ncbi:MAG: leucine-rich repeat domain-containing protein, partial [Promethearchaeota archaeon]
NCPLEDISEISKLHTLEELILEKVSLKALPQSIVNLKNLQRISIISTELEEFPTFFAQMPQLKRLVLKNLNSPLKTSPSRLITLNPAIWDIPSLEELVLIGFDAQEISSKIGNWEHLERFHFEGNCPKTLPDSIGKCKKLRGLILDGVAAPLPESFGDLIGLRTLHLANELILGLPHSIYRLSNLGTVLFRTHGDFHLPSWPEQLQTIPNLRNFIFKGKCSAPIPDWLGNLEKLKTIKLNGVLGPIPDTFGNLKNLSALEILDSKITNIPRSLARLPRLECLALENCGLTGLPDYFGEFRELTELFLRDNPIKKLPSTILQCQNLWRVDLRGCPIEDRKFLERFYDLENFRYFCIDDYC